MLPETLAPLIATFGYLVMLGLTLLRRDWKNPAITWLMVYLASLSGWGLLEAGLHLTGAAVDFKTLTYISVATTSFVFVYLTSAFLRLETRLWHWSMAGFSLLLLWSGFGLFQNSLPPALLFLVQGVWLQKAVAVFWGGVYLSTVRLVRETYRLTPGALHRNRLKYWIVAVALLIASHAAQFFGNNVVGLSGLLVATATLTYTILTHRPPDVRFILRRMLSYLLGAALSVAVYASLIVSGYGLMSTSDSLAVVSVAVGVSLSLVVLLNPVLRWARRQIQRLIMGTTYDPASTLREYSLSISNILDIERLALLVVGLIRSALGSKHGALFLVRREATAAGAETFYLRQIGREDAADAGALASTNPVAVYFNHQRRPLTQYDIDLLPQFRATAQEAHNWLAELNMDVYVPVYAKNEWIGVMALGPKLSGDRYFDDELNLLSTMADQTAVALENARLVDDLRRLNAEIQQAHTQLQELDRLKSSFIGVITHELRTPFANIIFSLQLLERHGLEHFVPEQREQFTELGQQVKALKQMIDNLVMFATLLSKQGALHESYFNFSALIQTTLEPLSGLAAGKGYALHTNIPALPNVRGDKERLSEAMYHLIYNAIKFNKPGGEIWVKAWHAPDGVYFEVTDTGQGLPSEKLAGLWDAFAQLADPLKRGAEGLGIGLALVKYVITAHNGEVFAESTLGAGSTFRFRLPMRHTKPLTAPLSTSAFDDARLSPPH